MTYALMFILNYLKLSYSIQAELDMDTQEHTQNLQSHLTTTDFFIGI